MKRHVEQVESWVRQVGTWANKAETWQILLVAVLALIILPAIPAILLLTILAGVVLFARVWLREFSLLMRLDDGAFPGRSDKLIWAMLLIVLPPVGVYLFRSYRLAHWPETKPTSPVHDLF